MFNMWMADRARLLKFLPFQGRVITKRMGLAPSNGDMASSCFRLPLLTMVNCTHLILQKG